MPRQCCFCFCTKVTREHLWGEWIGELLGQREYRFDRKHRGVKAGPWDSDSLNMKARVACAACNNGWMSDLEVATKLIIGDVLQNGTAKTFTAPELAMLATLVFTKAMVAGAMGSLPDFLSFGERSTFRRTLRIPNGVHMWFGRFPNGMRGVWKEDRIATAGNTSRDFKGQVFTFGFGFLFIQAVTARWKKPNTGRTTDNIRLTQDERWAAASTPFWPLPNSSVEWPPTHDLPYDSIDALSDRWKTVKLFERLR
jgi:hypothetical protein